MTAYKALHGLNRGKGAIVQFQEDDEDLNPQSKTKKPKKKARQILIEGEYGSKQLEKEENITTKDFDQQALLVDPLFKQKTKQFDELSKSNLLSATLAVDSNLLMTLDS